MDTKNPRAYLFVGITFLAVAIVFMITMQSPLWVAFLVLGIVFITLSTQKPKPETDATPTDTQPGDPRP